MTSLLETEPRTESEGLLGKDGLLEIDRGSVEALRKEIQEAQGAGYDVQIGTYLDEAYKKPKDIEKVFHMLESFDDQLDAEREDITKGLMADVVFPRLFSPKQKTIYDLLEFQRDRLMFGPSSGDARPWHWMKGRALALEAIVCAPRLKVAGDTAYSGEFEAMAGELDDSLLDMSFDERAGALRGVSLFDATVKAEQDFSGKSYQDALERVERRFGQTQAFLRAGVTPMFKDVVVNCTDSLGIRSRGEEVTTAITAHLMQGLEKGYRSKDKPLVMMSFGCGTARSILSVAREMRAQGVHAKVILLDQDPIALAAATKLAEKMGVGEQIEVHCERLFDRLGRPLDLSTVLSGRKLDVAEDSGLREYLPDGIYKNLAKQTWKHMAPGGISSTGNMNINRPQKRFLHGMMGWFPSVRMRYLADNFRLLEAAGIPKGATRCTITKDGVYNLFYSVKADS